MQAETAGTIFSNLSVIDLCRVTRCCKDLSIIVLKAHSDRIAAAKAAHLEQKRIELSEERRQQILKGLEDGGGFTDSERERSEYSGPDNAGDFTFTSSESDDTSGEHPTACPFVGHFQ